MTARDEILARIRASNAAAGIPVSPRSDSSRPATVEPVPSSDAEQAVLVERFVDRLIDYRAEVQVVAEAEVGAAVVMALVTHGAQSVIQPAGFPTSWLTAFEGEVVSDGELSPVALDTLDAVVTTSAIGIAETGTIILDHGAGQGRRALSLVPDLHVCVVRAAELVPDVPDAVRVLRPQMVTDAPPLTWISGPSATSDIELSRVEGVHGPRTLAVVIAT